MANGEESKAKIGAGALRAANRQAWGELTQTLVAFPQAGVQPVDVTGSLGSPTAAQVDREQQADPAAEYDKQLAAEAESAPKQRQRDKQIEM